jgi:hypothetical protein
LWEKRKLEFMLHVIIALCFWGPSESWINTMMLDCDVAYPGEALGVGEEKDHS